MRDRVYLDFYKLREMPFAITPDPAFLYLSNTHQSVIEKILHGIKSRMGFTPIIPDKVPETEPPTVEELEIIRSFDPDGILPRLTQ